MLRRGWSGEYASGQWGKLDISVDEVDLARILHQRGISQPVESIPIRVVFFLLEFELEKLLYGELMSRYGYPQESGNFKVAAAQDAQNQILDWLQGTG